jgi:hypothetical protein
MENMMRRTSEKFMHAMEATTESRIKNRSPSYKCVDDVLLFVA